MNNDPQKKLENILSSLDRNKVSEVKQKLSAMLNTPDGRKLAGELSGIDKNKLMNTFMSMNSQDIKKKLGNVDLSRLSSKDVDKILKNLK